MSPAKQGTAGNGGNGILITDAATSPVGTATRWNTISANGLAGIAIHGTVGSVKSSTSAAIDYNRIGTDPTGTIDMGNGGDGISIAVKVGSNIFVGSSGNSNGTPRNQISGNAGYAVRVSDDGSLTSSSTRAMVCLF